MRIFRTTVVVCAALGVIAGLLSGSSVAIPIGESHVQQYLDRVDAQDAATIAEASRLLTNLKQSPSPPCSDAELSYFRELVFHSDYLRDAGRMESGAAECSAISGRQGRPSHFKTGPSATLAAMGYREMVPIQDPTSRRLGMEQGNFFVVFGSHLPDIDAALPIHLQIQPYEPASTSSKQQPAVSDSVVRQGDLLVGKHCSAALSSCVTATVSIGDVRRNEAVLSATTVLMFGLIGAAIGMVLTLLRRRSMAMENQLRKAVEEDKLHVVYQPIVNLADGKIVGAEALARWTRPDGSTVPPDVFIKLAEEHGFINSITQFVLRRTLAEFRTILSEIPDFRLNVNVSTADLENPQFLPSLDQIVRKARIPTSSLAFEVTERSAADREVAKEALRMLRRRGHHISIDDFGTGFSNLSYLLYLSIDTIKIDRAFVRAIGTESVAVAILPQIIAMARSMNLGIVAEGIELERQACYFPTDNIRMYGQGWLYGRPVTAEEFSKLLGLTVESPAPAVANVPAYAGPAGLLVQPTASVPTS